MTTLAPDPILDIKDLSIEYGSGARAVPAVSGASLFIRPGEVVGLVGESGSGKTTLGQAIVRLGEFEGGRIVSGSIEFEGRDVVKLSKREIRELRGRRIGMVFQNPMSSLNPTQTIGDQVAEALSPAKPRRASSDRAVELLGAVGIPDPDGRRRNYPHELSGGMRQRVMITMALGRSPDLLIADEPTTALDVTIQAQVFWVLEDLRRRLGTAMLLITHNLPLAASFCDRIVVMYAGKVVETGPAQALVRRPTHPYTRALVASIPRGHWRTSRISTTARDPGAAPLGVGGCPYQALCDRRVDACATEFPPTTALATDPSRLVACHNPIPAPGASRD